MLYLISSSFGVILIILCISSAVLEETLLEITEHSKPTGFSIGGLIVAMLLVWNIGALATEYFYDHNLYSIKQYFSDSTQFPNWIVLHFPLIIISTFGSLFLLWAIIRNITLRSRLKQARKIALADRD